MAFTVILVRDGGDGATAFVGHTGAESALEAAEIVTREMRDDDTTSTIMDVLVFRGAHDALPIEAEDGTPVEDVRDHLNELED